MIASVAGAVSDDLCIVKTVPEHYLSKLSLEMIDENLADLMLEDNVRIPQIPQVEQK
jgi:ADP-ribosylglycohydrolase